jgi:hypothetical protein
MGDRVRHRAKNISKNNLDAQNQFLTLCKNFAK